MAGVEGTRIEEGYPFIQPWIYRDRSFRGRRGELNNSPAGFRLRSRFSDVFFSARGRLGFLARLQRLS